MSQELDMAQSGDSSAPNGTDITLLSGIQLTDGLVCLVRTGTLQGWPGGGLLWLCSMAASG